MRLLSAALLCLLTAACDDGDRDGFDAPEDCDDTRADVNPEAVEACDGVDNDCDGLADPPGSEGTRAFYADQDDDGFGDETYVVKACQQPAGFVATFGDCDDTTASITDGC